MKNPNNDKTNIKRWNPPKIKDSGLFYLEGLYDDYKGFRLILKGERESDEIVELLFENNLAYRNLDESQRLKTLNENSILTKKWSFFKTKDSSFLDWFNNESYNIYKTEKLTHYIIVTPNDIVDIITDEEPKINVR